MKVDVEQLRRAYLPKPPARSDFGIAVVGLGYSAFAHIPAYLKAGWKVAAIADKNPARLEGARKRFGLDNGYEDWRKAVERPDVHIVDIAIPQEGRVEMVKTAASLGKHVLIQKPFAHKFEHALAMVEACERGGVKLAVNQNARYVGCNSAAKWLMEQGTIGTPFFFHEHQVVHAGFETHALIELSVHYLDILRWWAGQEPQFVSATLLRSPAQDAPDKFGVVVTLEFAEGLTGHLTDQNAVNAGNDWGMRFRIDGTHGALKGGYDIIPNSMCWQLNTFIALWSSQEGSRWSQWNINDFYWVPDAHVCTMGELMDAVATGREPSISGRDNLNTVRLCLAAYRSAAEKRKVRPNEIRPGD